MNNILFSPITINSLTIPNRFVRSATQDYYANDDGSVSKENLQLYEALKAIGLIVSGFIYVSENGKCTLGQLGLYDDSLIPSFKQLTDVVHKNNGIIFAQLVHGGRQVTKKYVPGEIWAPSSTPVPDGNIVPKAMTDEDIHKTINDFTSAVKRAVQAGFDGVQFHAAHGYLLNQFLSPYTNKRTDEWGGPFDNRIRIILEILRRSRKIVGDNYPLIIKINGDDGGIKGGLTIRDSVKAAKLLNKASIDAIEVSRGMVASPEPTVVKEIVGKKDEAYILPQAYEIKQEVNVPVISVGGFRSVDVMENAIQEGKCDMIALSRPFIREPDLVLLIQKGQGRSKCISCSKCFNLRGIKCVNKDYF